MNKPHTYPNKSVHDAFDHGIFFVCRADKKPLQVAHMVAITQYLRAKITVYCTRTGPSVITSLVETMSLCDDGAYQPGLWLDMMSKDDFNKWYADNVGKMERGFRALSVFLVHMKCS